MTAAVQMNRGPHGAEQQRASSSTAFKKSVPCFVSKSTNPRSKSSTQSNQVLLHLSPNEEQIWQSKDAHNRRGLRWRQVREQEKKRAVETREKFQKKKSKEQNEETQEEKLIRLLEAKKELANLQQLHESVLSAANDQSVHMTANPSGFGLTTTIDNTIEERLGLTQSNSKQFSVFPPNQSPAIDGSIMGLNSCDTLPNTVYGKGFLRSEELREAKQIQEFVDAYRQEQRSKDERDRFAKAYEALPLAMRKKKEERKLDLERSKSKQAEINARRLMELREKAAKKKMETTQLGQKADNLVMCQDASGYVDWSQTRFHVMRNTNDLEEELEQIEEKKLTASTAEMKEKREQRGKEAIRRMRAEQASAQAQKAREAAQALKRQTSVERIKYNRESAKIPNMGLPNSSSVSLSSSRVRASPAPNKKQPAQAASSAKKKQSPNPSAQSQNLSLVQSEIPAASSEFNETQNSSLLQIPSSSPFSHEAGAVHNATTTAAAKEYGYENDELDTYHGEGEEQLRFYPEPRSYENIKSGPPLGTSLLGSQNNSCSSSAYAGAGGTTTAAMITTAEQGPGARPTATSLVDEKMKQASALLEENERVIQDIRNNLLHRSSVDSFVSAASSSRAAKVDHGEKKLAPVEASGVDLDDLISSLRNKGNEAAELNNSNTEQQKIATHDLLQTSKIASVDAVLQQSKNNIEKALRSSADALRLQMKNTTTGASSLDNSMLNDTARLEEEFNEKVVYPAVLGTDSSARASKQAGTATKSSSSCSTSKNNFSPSARRFIKEAFSLNDSALSSSRTPTGTGGKNLNDGETAVVDKSALLKLLSEDVVKDSEATWNMDDLRSRENTIIVKDRSKAGKQVFNPHDEDYGGVEVQERSDTFYGNSASSSAEAAENRIFNYYTRDAEEEDGNDEMGANEEEQQEDFEIRETISVRHPGTNYDEEPASDFSFSRLEPEETLRTTQNKPAAVASANSSRMVMSGSRRQKDLSTLTAELDSLCADLSGI
ncbi:unnamed protein product [Amoebophrya sp. A120]|nr:unnamed protein product [Amoebophrya sp. A120]|eukprot:GSA120T00004071001.1